MKRIKICESAVFLICEAYIRKAFLKPDNQTFKIQGNIPRIPIKPR
ncbi:MAG: hypothetical protein AOA65_1566 [Candidatus Bathyarchaeota archaeon BA1]|nr:MAG: hypothetical protein AOA65_1566 [Candidatus Bathyarchaeota archaeon BA1]